MSKFGIAAIRNQQLRMRCQAYNPSWAKKGCLGCVNSHHAYRGSQEAGFTQPRDHSFAQPCTFTSRPPLSSSIKRPTTTDSIPLPSFRPIMTAASLYIRRQRRRRNLLVIGVKWTFLSSPTRRSGDLNPRFRDSGDGSLRHHETSDPFRSGAAVAAKKGGWR